MAELAVEQPPADFGCGRWCRAGGNVDGPPNHCDASTIVLLDIVSEAVVERVPVVTAPIRKPEGCVQCAVRLESGGHHLSIEFHLAVVPTAQEVVDRRPCLVLDSIERSREPWQFAVHPGLRSRHDPTLVVGNFRSFARQHGTVGGRVMRLIGWGPGKVARPHRRLVACRFTSFSRVQQSLLPGPESLVVETRLKDDEVLVVDRTSRAK